MNFSNTSQIETQTWHGKFQPKHLVFGKVISNWDLKWEEFGNPGCTNSLPSNEHSCSKVINRLKSKFEIQNRPKIMLVSCLDFLVFMGKYFEKSLESKVV